MRSEKSLLERPLKPIAGLDADSLLEMTESSYYRAIGSAEALMANISNNVCPRFSEFLFESRNGRIRLFVLGPPDLTVTKVGRSEDHDRQDIE